MIYFEVSESIQSSLESHLELGELLQRTAQEALTKMVAPQHAEITLLLSDDEQLHRLNREFLNTDSPTDVLSFPADFSDPETGAPYLGDIAISFPAARAQAQAGGHPVADELQLLVVHGVLHLLGYDHVEKDQKEEMWARQAEILTNLGCSIISPPE